MIIFSYTTNSQFNYFFKKMNPFFENAPGGGKSDEEIKNFLFQQFLEFRNQAEQQKNDRIVNDLRNFDLFGEPQQKQENPKNIPKKKSEYEAPNKNANKVEMAKPPDYKEMTLDDLIKNLKEKDEKITNLEVQIVVLQAEKKEFQEKSDELQSHMLFLPEAGRAMQIQMEKQDKELSGFRKKCENMESELKQSKEKSEQEIQQLKEKLRLENEKNKMKVENQKFEEGNNKDKLQKTALLEEKNKTIDSFEKKPQLKSIISEESKNEKNKTENSNDRVLSARNLEIFISGEQEGEFQNDQKKVGNLTSRHSLSSKFKILLNIINISQKKQFSI